MPDHPSFVSRKQVTEVYLKAIRLIDDRVTPLLGKVTTRVLVQGAAKRLISQYPYLDFLAKMAYADIDPSAIQEQLPDVSPQELAAGLNALLDECFNGLRELTGNIIAPPLHEEVTRHIQQQQQQL